MEDYAKFTERLSKTYPGYEKSLEDLELDDMGSTSSKHKGRKQLVIDWNKLQPDSQAEAQQEKPQTQNTSVAEEALLRMTNAFMQTLQTFTKTQNKVTTQSPYQFYGQEHENPLRFIHQLDTYFERNEIYEDYDKLAIAINQLKGVAQKWFEPYQTLIGNYENFKNRLKNKYNSPAAISCAMSKLYGEKQKDNEQAAEFITKKRNLFSRLNPDISEQMMVSVITDQLKPDIRSRLRGNVILDTEELIRVATQLESDLDEINNHYHDSRKNVNHYQNKSRNNGNNPDVPPSACRFCGAWHFQRDCPKNPYLKPENANRVEGPTTSGTRQPAQTKPTTPKTKQ